MKKQFCFFIALILILSFTVLPAAAAEPTAAGGKVNTPASVLNVRAAPSTDSEIRAQLADDTWVTILSGSGAWYRVQYGVDDVGYVSSKYITPKSGSYLAFVNTGNSNLNVRRGAGTTAEIKAKLPDKSRVAVLTESGGWATILFHGSRKGYVAARYLTVKAPDRIALSVPHYLQTDRRWKNIAIGKSGGTLGTIGCTTTCLAMAESHRTGKAVTPDVMASRLTYAPGGSLYWPKGYTAEFSGSDALQRVKALLLDGTPVIFGAKKANGTQHWVVVTGCTGSSSTSSFTINDPAGTSRTTLADFLAVYPNYYKFAYAN